MDQQGKVAIQSQGAPIEGWNSCSDGPIRMDLRSFKLHRWYDPQSSNEARLRHRLGVPCILPWRRERRVPALYVRIYRYSAVFYLTNNVAADYSRPSSLQ